MLVSVIVPVYKSKDYLGDCVESILAQDYREIEVILVDDGSPDQSGIICDTFAECDERIRIIHKSNRGVSSARNLGLVIARGEWILFCDSDDVVSTNWVSIMVSLVESNGTNLAICNYSSFSDQITEEENEYLGVQTGEYCHGMNLWILREKHLLFMPWNKIYRRKIIEENGIKMPESWQYGEDFNFVLNYMNAIENEKIAVTEEMLYYYRQSVLSSLTHKSHPNLWEITKINFEMFYKLLKNPSETFISIKKDFYTTWLWEICLNINNYKALNNWTQIKQILKSNEMREALAFGDCRKAGITKKYEMLLRLKNPHIMRLAFFLLSHA